MPTGSSRANGHVPPDGQGRAARRSEQSRRRRDAEAVSLGWNRVNFEEVDPVRVARSPGTVATLVSDSGRLSKRRTFSLPPSSPSFDSRFSVFDSRFFLRRAHGRADEERGGRAAAEETENPETARHTPQRRGSRSQPRSRFAGAGRTRNTALARAIRVLVSRASVDIIERWQEWRPPRPTEEAHAGRTDRRAYGRANGLAAAGGI